MPKFGAKALCQSTGCEGQRRVTVDPAISSNEGDRVESIPVTRSVSPQKLPEALLGARCYQVQHRVRARWARPCSQGTTGGSGNNKQENR